MYFTDDWQKEINKLWEIILEDFEVTLDPSCGTHVHFKMNNPGERNDGYGLKDIQCFSKAIVYYEPCIKACVPKNRRENTLWAKSNVDYPEPGSPVANMPSIPGIWKSDPQIRGFYEAGDYNGLYKFIDDFKDHKPLVHKVSPSKTFAWTLQHIDSVRCGTIEFRSPPQVQDKRTTCHWIAFTLSVLEISLSCNFGTMQSKPGQEKFRTEMKNAAKRLNLTDDLQDLDEMAQDVQTTRLSKEEMEKIARLKVKKAEKPSEFAEKVRRSLIG